jgi:hypothetical protein
MSESPWRTLRACEQKRNENRGMLIAGPFTESKPIGSTSP